MPPKPVKKLPKPAKEKKPKKKPGPKPREFKQVINPAIPIEPENWHNSRKGIEVHHTNSIKRMISLELSGNGFPYDMRAINRVYKLVNQQLEKESFRHLESRMSMAIILVAAFIDKAKK